MYVMFNILMRNEDVSTAVDGDHRALHNKLRRQKNVDD